MARSYPKKENKIKSNLRYFRRYWTLYLLLLFPVAYFIIFKYIPMTYIQIAFKKYSIVQSPWEMPWAD
ncbi:MAG: sugar ABC transporter permease, partial [Clostridiaceae bacterium]|nr:sugar ABC transporter permease [Clostridiaceae bacterium]